MPISIQSVGWLFCHFPATKKRLKNKGIKARREE